MSRRSLKHVLVVGAGPLARATLADLRKRRGMAVMGVLTLPGETPHDRLETPVLGPVSELPQHLFGTLVDEVYMAGDMVRDHAALQEAIVECERIGTAFALPATPFRLHRSTPRGCRLGADGFIHYRPGFAQPWGEPLKRAIDVAGAAAGLIVLSPLLLLVAALVKATSAGPVFFGQLRVGRNGRMFRMLKFRSMVMDAEKVQRELLDANEQEGPVFKIRCDPRITRVGAFIRRYSIDELPQLWNVLVGDMSIVGPRPPILREVQQYKPWQRRRLSVRPGLTCFWQVSGRNAIGFDEWMKLDLRYVDQWSVGTDLRLILRTIPVVLTGSGAS